MDTVIGLGQTGCSIANEFAKYDQYKIYKIDTGDPEEWIDWSWASYDITNEADMCEQTGTYMLPVFNSPEEYEEKFPDMGRFFREVKGEILFIVSGSEIVSSSSLRVLENLKHCDINILYIRSGIESLGSVSSKQEWVVFNVLQEYARSGVFKRIYLVSNPQIEEHLGKVPVIGYYDKINDMIVTYFHMINVYNHIEPVVDTFFDPMDVCRISTIGFYNEKTNENKLFFPLDNIREMRYYYAINKKKLETDGEIMKKVREQTRDKIKTCYGIYATNYEQDYVYTVAYASTIQQQKK